jgi:hypothetical protein
MKEAQRLVKVLLDYEPDNKMLKEYNKYIAEYIAQGMVCRIYRPFALSVCRLLQVWMRKTRKSRSRKAKRMMPKVTKMKMGATVHQNRKRSRKLRNRNGSSG